MKNLAAAIGVISLTACAQPGPNGQYNSNSGINKQDVGTVLGGVGGAVAGSAFGKGNGKIATTIAGGLLGGVLGNQIGASLDRADMAYYNKSSQQALESSPSGQAVTWKNPDSGNSGTITPMKTYQSPSDPNQYCREYTQSITVAGKTQQAYGTACRQPDGTWQVQQ